MRKFRAFIKETGAILDVVVLDWYGGEVRCVIGGQYECPCSGRVEADYDFPVFTLDEVILMQSTGLSDKKRTKEFPDGQPIYEGDICKNGDWVEDADAYCYRVEEVRYCQQEGAFHGWNHNEDGMTCEVIGNIHSNPELLK